MKKITGEKQLLIMGIIVILGFILATILKKGIIVNIAWVMAGILPIINPVCPNYLKKHYGNDNKRVKRDSIIGGIIVIILGFLIRFGV